MQAVLQQILITEIKDSKVGQDPFGSKIGIFGRLFGCRHKNFTRPITVNNLSYRACLDCGARRKFDAQNFKTSRAFYYPPSVTFDRS